MKKIILLFAISFIAIQIYGQGQMDALKYSGTDLSGSARGVAMGGAFGALGGDITGIAQNPAGIGVYRSSEILGTLSLSSVNTETTSSSIVKDNRSNFNFSNIAYVGYMPLVGDVSAVNFGFSYNRLKNFGRNYNSRGNGLTSSLTDYIAEYTTRNANVPAEKFEENNAYSLFPWISVLGYNGGLINDNGDRYISSLMGPQATREDGTLQTVDRIYSVSERGHIDSYDFTMGTNISDIVYLGLTLSFTDMRYNLNSRHTEEFERGNEFKGGGFDFDNSLETSGAGYQVSIGAIFRPIDELRLGIAYHSPTWYNLTDSYSAGVNYEGWLLDPNNFEWDWDNISANTPRNSFTEYRLTTPDRWVMSIAGVIGSRAIISLDYEYSDYSKIRLRDGNNGFNNEYRTQNEYISQDFVGASTLKAGLEYRVTPQLSLRAGYAWMQSPLEKSFKAGLQEVLPSGTVTAYTLDGDINYYSAGIGYRFTPNFYMDFAFSVRQQTSELYTYSPIWNDMNELVVSSDPAGLKNNTYTGLLTLGYRF